jgi:hypothetical protein
MKPGSLLICVDDQFPFNAAAHFTSLPVKNKVYVLRALIPNKDPGGPDGVALEEIWGLISTFTSSTGQEVTIEISFKMIRFKEVLPPMDIAAIITEESECVEVLTE